MFCCRGRLQIRADSVKYSIPLSGYGGLSELVIDTLRDQGMYVANMGGIVKGVNATSKVTK